MANFLIKTLWNLLVLRIFIEVQSQLGPHKIQLFFFNNHTQSSTLQNCLKYNQLFLNIKLAIKKMCFPFWTLHHGWTHSFTWAWCYYIAIFNGWLMILLVLLAFGNLAQTLKRHLSCFRAGHKKNSFISWQHFYWKAVKHVLCKLHSPRSVYLNSLPQSTFWQTSIKALNHKEKQQQPHTCSTACFFFF